MPKGLHLCEPEGPRTTETSSIPIAVNVGPPTVPPNTFQAARANAPATGAAHAGVVWDDRRLDVKCNTKQLYCSDQQLRDIQQLDADGKMLKVAYTPSTQKQATDLLAREKLDSASLGQLESRWSVAWGDRWYRKGTRTHARRVLYQCACGYDTQARQRGKAKKPQAEAQPDAAEWTRRAPYEYTGCLAHAEVTFVEGSGEIIRVMGYFEHNKACEESMLVRFPAVPLHPHVVEIALLQLRSGADVAQIRNKNMEMFTRQLYRGQREADPMLQNARYELQTSDFSRLYRQHYRADYGIDVSILPEYNVDNWLDPKSPHYKRDIAESVFHYAARAEQNERVKICIATPEMRTAAWKYVHRQQLVLDGTFGVCTSRLLLWIAMGVDEAHHGVPVAMFLFSAPSGNRATHAGYDTAVLTELLGEWKTWMGCTLDEAKHSFEPFVAMTDTDTKERGALLRIWPDIILLLCKFHVRQCWKNKRNTLFGKQLAHWKSYLESRAQNLEETLLQTVSHAAATALLANEEETLCALAADTAGQKASQAGLSYIAYLRSMWMPVAMWTGWSKKGRQVAAERMGCAVEDVLPTTNHLEAFNGSLKRNHLRQWQHSGARLRFDILLFHLAVNILPRVYARHRMLLGFRRWKVERFRAAAGGQDLLVSSATQSSSQRAAKDTAQAPLERPWFYFQPDARRDTEAEAILRRGLLRPVYAQVSYELWAECTSTAIPPPSVAQAPPIRYKLTFHPSGVATCSCPDWRSRGGACKHLRAFRMVISSWATSGYIISNFPSPQSCEEAKRIDAQNQLWYGIHYERSVTTAPLGVTSPDASAQASPQAAPGTRTSPSEPRLTLPPLVQSAVFLPPPSVSDSAASLENELQLLEAAKDGFSGGDQTDDGGDVETDSENGSQVAPQPGDISSENLSSAAPGTQSARAGTSSSTSVLSREAVTHQLRQQVNHDIKQVLPVLHGLAVTLRVEGLVLEASTDIQEFQELMADISESLGSANVASSAHLLRPDRPPACGTKAPASSGNTEPTKRIRGPSPERQQKRKKSYKTM